MAKQHDKQFKLDAIQYYQDHKDLGVRGCAENLGIGYSTLTKWLKDFRESGDIPVRGSGNYASYEQKEIARLRRELRDAQDALDVLKKAINILGKPASSLLGSFRLLRHFEINGFRHFPRMLKFLGVSRSGYPVFLLLQIHGVFLYQKARGGAMHDILNVRHLKISTFRRRKTGVQPFGQLPSSQTLRDKWLPSFSQNVDCFF